MYKLIAIDLDDTTITSDRRITPAVRQAVSAATKAGVTVMAATGRGYRGAAKLLDEIGLVGPTICFAGAAIADHPSGRFLYTDLMSKELARQTIAFAMRHGAYIQVFDGVDYYFERSPEYAARYAGTSLFEGITTDFNSFAFDHTFKTLIINDDRLPQLYEAACRELGGLCEISISGAAFLEFNNLGATKGKALASLAEQMQIPREEIIAVGDNIIDIAMIQYAGLGVAVQNAVPEVLAAADYVCPSNDQDGVAHVINRFILEG